MNKKFHNVSLGQGQEVVAESAMEMAASGENQLKYVHLHSEMKLTLFLQRATG